MTDVSIDCYCLPQQPRQRVQGRIPLGTVLCETGVPELLRVEDHERKLNEPLLNSI